MVSSARNILFITWDGPETSYLEGLFLPIFARLKTSGFAPHVLQFSWGDKAVHSSRSALCRAAGIPYRHVPVWRGGGGAGPILTSLYGVRHVRRAIRDWTIDTLVPRSLMPALTVLRLSRAERRSLSLVFDADGLPADERVDFGGLSSHGLTYRVLRDIEAEILRQANSVLCRTEAAKAILIARAGGGVRPDTYHVVLNGKDPLPFADALMNRKVKSKDAFRLCYSGSIGAQYRLPEMLELATILKRSIPNLVFDIFSPSSVHIEREMLRMGLAEERWISSYFLPSVAIPSALVECDLALALRQQSFSMQAVQPIKIGEYLLAGLPVIGTPNIGDAKQLIGEGVFRSAESVDREETLRWIINVVIPQRDHMRRLCHEIGKKYFSIEEATKRYAVALQLPTVS